MTRLQCGCVGAFGSQCSRDATQEDLLCDQCRSPCAECNAVLIYADGGHEHVKISDRVPVFSLPVSRAEWSWK